MDRGGNRADDEGWRRQHTAATGAATVRDVVDRGGNGDDEEWRRKLKISNLCKIMTTYVDIDRCSVDTI